MDFASPLSELVKELWGLASKPLGYICNLKDNLDALRSTTRNLEATNGDVTARVERQERGGGEQRTNRVENWLRKVREFKGGVDQVLQEAGERDRIKCLSRCLPQNCWSSYKLGKRVDQLLNEARELQHEEREFQDFTSPLPRPPVLSMPMDETVGLDISLNQVWEWVVNEKQIGIIGLYGTGGVGKTTLMKMINNKLLRENHGFEAVILVVVSKQVDEDNIRDVIRKGLNIEDKIWERWSQGERVDKLLNVLTQKKFVLLIDDIWDKLNLPEIGVPRASLKNGSKVVFTTRLIQVCKQMDANIHFEVQCLTPEEGLKLFEKNIGKSLVDCHQDIQELAKDIVKECKSLPLALITVGRAMAGIDSPPEWRDALTKLRSKPHKLPGMQEVYRTLEFSYDRLDAAQQACFLSCCLFPEDYLIITNDLIELWIGEGLIEDPDDVYKMRDDGASILGVLNRACLLERWRDREKKHVEMKGWHDREKEYVKMHDVIRDMAIWIARDHGQRENKLLVIEKGEDMSTNMISKWKEAEKVSLWGKQIWNIDQAPPTCSQLKTLMVRATSVRVLPRGFFDPMKGCLTILDLSDNRFIESLPEGICELINLWYLNLSGTGINRLPEEIKKLIHLRWLLLDCMYGDILIPIGVTSLPLNVFNLGSFLLENEEEVVEKLGGMQDLIDLSIVVQKSSSMLKIFQSLQRCIRRVKIEYCEDLTYIPVSHSLKGSENYLHLEVLELRHCPMLVKMEITQEIGRAPNCPYFPSLIEVRLHNCGILDLSWLVHAPKLQRLRVAHCDSMQKIIRDEFAREKLAISGLFSHLESLYVVCCLNLESICDHTLFFPQGVKFLIDYCPGLRKLPLDSNSATRSFSISGDERWWSVFEWDRAARVLFNMEEEMTFGEAAPRANLDNWIGFLPREQSV